MFPLEDFAPSLRKLATIFERLKISYHLTGGIAAIAHGEPRLTQDLDAVADPVAIQQRKQDLMQALASSDFLFYEDSVRAAIRDGGMFQLLDKLESLKIDVYVREIIPGELSRSVSLELFGTQSYPIASRGDVALSKLVWISKGSHKSRADLRALYRGADEVTRARIAATAERMGHGALLAEVLSEPDEIV
jgi:hypothetical protein